MGVLRESAVDLYFNSLRLLGANLLWAAVLILVLLLGSGSLLLFIAASALLALPTAVVFRLAAVVVRGDPGSFWEALAAGRRIALPALGAGVVLAICATVFLGNVAIGLSSGDPFGFALATLGFWSLLGLGASALVFWPILVDPRRPDSTLRERLRLTVLLLLAFPLRFAALLLVATLVLAVSTVLFAALLTIAVAYVALVCCHYVLPAADRFEGRATQPVIS